MVGPAEGSTPRVEIASHLVGGPHSYILRQEIVERRAELPQWVLGVSEEVDYLALGVGSGVGAAGPSDPDGFPCKPGQRLFQLTLNRRRLPLELETGVPGTLVFD